MASNRIQIGKSSRYVGTPVYRLRDALGDPTDSVAFGVWNRIVIPDRDDDLVHRVTQDQIGRMDLVAADYYSDPLLWWVIADKNNISDPFDDMYPGQELRIPALGGIRAALSAAAAKR